MKQNKIYLRESLVVSILIFVAIALGMLQTIVYALKTPLNTQFLYIHNYIEDYYYYLHVMRQGFDGMWKATSFMTAEVFEPQYINIFFLMLGHLSRTTSISLPFMYTLSRGVGGIILMILIYFVIRILFPMSKIVRLGAFLFALFGTYWWGWGAGGPTVASFVHEWTELDPMFRWSYIPHHLWSKVFMLLLFIILLSAYNKYRSWHIVAITLTIIGIGLTSPVVFATLLPVLGILLMLEIISSRFFGSTFKPMVFFILISTIVFSLIVTLYFRQLSVSTFPWTTYSQWETNVRYTLPISAYVASFGPLLILFAVSIPSLYRKNFGGRLMLAWAVSGFFMIYVGGKFVPLSNVRYLEGYQFIPVAIGGAYGLHLLTHFFKKYSQQIFIFCVLSLLVYFSIGFYVSFREHEGYIKQNTANPQVYVAGSTTGMFSYLDEFTPHGSVVLAPYYLSTMLPAFTGNRAVGGHQLMTVDPVQKRQDIDEFYTYNSLENQKEIINRYSIKYVVVEKNTPLPEDMIQGLKLEYVFDNASLILYKTSN